MFKFSYNIFVSQLIQIAKDKGRILKTKTKKLFLKYININSFFSYCHISQKGIKCFLLAIQLLFFSLTIILLVVFKHPNDKLGTDKKGKLSDLNICNDVNILRWVPTSDKKLSFSVSVLADILVEMSVSVSVSANFDLSVSAGIFG